MKRSLSFILTLVMVIGIITSVPVAVSAAGEEVFTFESYGSYCYVSASSTDISGEIIIPGEYNGLPVRGISNFQNCPNVTSIVISDGVEEIGWSAFKGCTNLTTVTIGKDLCGAGMGAFTGCNSLTAIFVDEDNEKYTSEDGVLFNKDKTMLIQYPLGKADSSYTIPDGVTDVFQGSFRGSVNLETVIISDSVITIDPFAFDFSNNLKSVIFSDSVQSIGAGAFCCPAIKAVAIPASVTTIGENAFGYYYSETYELLKVEDFKIFGVKGSAAKTYANENGFEFIEGTEVIEESVLTFELNEDGESYSVTGCNTAGDGELIIPEIYNGLPVTNIGEGAFYNCDTLTSIIIPDSVKSIGDYAFENCTSLISITIPDSVTSIGEMAFNQTGYYNDINNWENNVLYINNHLIYSKVNGECIIKDGIKTIADDAFSYTGLTSITIPDSITNIGFYAFNNCKSLKNVYISDIGVWCNITFSNAFANPLYYAKNLYINGELATDIVIPDTVTQLNDFIFYNHNTLKSISIPDCVTSIGKSAFYNCGNLNSVKIPVNVTRIGEAAFYECSNLEKIYWNAQCVKDFVSYSEVFYNAGTAGSGISLVFGDSVKKIPAYLFYVNSSYNPEIITVTISDSVTSIGFGAFYNCDSISNVYYAGDNTQWKNINIAGKNESLLGGKIHCELTEKIVAPSLKSIKNTQYGVLIKWGKVTGAEQYRIYRKIGTGFYEYIGSTSNTYFTDKEAPSGKTCRYRIRAKNEAGYSEYSDTLALKHIDEPTLKSIENSEYGVLIKWDKVTGAEKYNVYRKVSGGDYEYIGVTENTYYTDKTAESGTKYYYAIRGKRDTSVSSQSASLSKYYLEDPTLNTPSSTSKGIGLRWSKIAGAEGYKVYRKTADGSYKLISTEKGGSNVTFRDTTAEKGTKYYYKVKAYKSKTYSAYSNTKSVTDKY